MAGKTQRLKQLLIEGIRTGTYPIGSRLPSVRSAAKTFDVHPNTVSRAYGDLVEEGLVRTVHGSGSYVIAFPRTTGSAAADDLRDALEDLAVQARRLGLSRRQWRHLAEDASAIAFERGDPAIWFVECSARDAQELAEDLSAFVEREVRPSLVDAVRDNEVLAASRGACLVTTPFHRDELDALVHDRHTVVQVDVVPTSETLVAFARLDPASRIVVLASNERTLARFVRVLHDYTRMTPSDTRLVDAPDAEEVARSADVVIDSHSIHDQVAAWNLPGTCLTIRHQIEPTSVSYLREVLRRSADRSAVGQEA